MELRNWIKLSPIGFRIIGIGDTHQMNHRHTRPRTYLNDVEIKDVAGFANTSATLIWLCGLSSLVWMVDGGAMTAWTALIGLVIAMAGSLWKQYWASVILNFIIILLISLLIFNLSDASAFLSNIEADKCGKALDEAEMIAKYGILLNFTCSSMGYNLIQVFIKISATFNIPIFLFTIIEVLIHLALAAGLFYWKRDKAIDKKITEAQQWDKDFTKDGIRRLL